jgi:transcriptional regulator with XRE-family HTH domain
MATTGDRIRERREHRGWTQEGLAGKAGVSKGFLSDLENNKRNVSADYALRIANALGVSLDYLIRGEITQRDIERAPVSIPPELSIAAQELNLTYAQTLTLIDAHEAVIARRGLRRTSPPSVANWKHLHGLIMAAYPDDDKT